MTENRLEFTIEEAGERLDKLIVARVEGISRVQVQAMIKEGHVTVNGAPVKAGIKLRGGEIVSVILPEAPQEAELLPEEMPLDIVFEDEVLAVINKSAGVVIHPGLGNETGTLVNAIISRYPDILEMNDPDKRRGIVHRLDKETSGLIIIARTAHALKHLMKQFQSRTVSKTYIALVERVPKTMVGRIDAPIARDPRVRKRMAVVREGKEAITEFRVIDRDFRDGQALVEFDLLTGRTHQIRVHAAFIGCPVVGDRVYGFRKQRTRMKRLFLHAAKLSFDHPVTGERMHFETPLPPVLQEVMSKMRE